MKELEELEVNQKKKESLHELIQEKHFIHFLQLNHKLNKRRNEEIVEE